MLDRSREQQRRRPLRACAGARRPAAAQQPTGPDRYNYHGRPSPVKPYLAPDEVDPRDVEVTCCADLSPPLKSRWKRSSE